MAGQGFVGDVLQLGAALGEEALGGGADAGVIAGDLDLGDAVQADGHTLRGVHVVDADLDGEQLQRQHVDALDHRPDEGAPGFDDPVATSFRLTGCGVDDRPLAAGDDQHLVRADRPDTAEIDDQDGDQHEEQDEKSKTSYGGWHGFLLEIQHTGVTVRLKPCDQHSLRAASPTIRASIRTQALPARQKRRRRARCPPVPRPRAGYPRPLRSARRASCAGRQGRWRSGPCPGQGSAP